jgi:hypothetical protein
LQDGQHLQEVLEDLHGTEEQRSNCEPLGNGIIKQLPTYGQNLQKVPTRVVVH